MALWGDRDNFQSVAAGIATVDLSNLTVDIGAAPFTAGIGTITPIIKLGLGATCGFAEIVGVSSTRLVSIANTDAIIPDAVGAVAGVAYSLTQAPRSLDENPAAVSQSAGAISTTRYFGVGSTAMYNAFENLSDSGNLGMAFTSAYRPLTLVGSVFRLTLTTTVISELRLRFWSRCLVSRLVTNHILTTKHDDA